MKEIIINEFSLRFEIPRNQPKHSKIVIESATFRLRTPKFPVSRPNIRKTAKLCYRQKKKTLSKSRVPSCVAPVCSKRSLRDATWSVTLLRQRYGARSLSTFQNDADHGRKRSTLGENFRKIDSLCSLEKREVTNFLDVFFCSRT